VKGQRSWPAKARARHNSPLTSERPSSHDIAIVGAGAAGLATAIFTKQLHPRRAVLLLDGASRLGAKILVSGGSRCNVTNTAVTDADFWGGRRSVIRRVLRGFPVDNTIAFFREIGVPLHEEADGKLFPDSNRARDVLKALLDEASRVGVTIGTGTRVSDVAPMRDGFRIATTTGNVTAARVVLATGGRSLPKSGSDGAGFDIARGLGHTIVPTTPGLVPLLLRDEPHAMHRELSGVAHDAELTLWIDDAVDIRLTGSLLWTHFGISGPLTLNMSRHLLRANLDGRRATLSVSFCPGRTFEDVERWWMARLAERPHASVSTPLSMLVPASVADALLQRAGVNGATTLAHFARDDRRRLSHALVKWPLPVTGDRGYNYAEVTAGGVSLDEIDPATMASRVCEGLSLVGEILDVDGRIGGFNFQWAWSSARVAATALGA
jgi:predicted Rossmann fold flavoprotein